MRTIARLAPLLVVLALPGCGKEVVVGGQKEVDTYATGDGTPEGSPSLAPSYAVAPGGGGPVATHIAGRAQGTVTFDARVSLVAGAGAPEPVNLAASPAVVRIDGHDTTFVAGGRVPRVRYTAVRVAFTRVRAGVASGLVIGGVSLTGEVRVNIATGDSIVVEVPLALDDPEADEELLIDLDASAWLPAANPATRLVAATAFRNAVKVRRL
jgi:hypothetical protein